MKDYLGAKQNMFGGSLKDVIDVKETLSFQSLSVAKQSFET